MVNNKSLEYIAEGKRLRLRRMTIDDSEMIVRWRNQEWVRRNYVYRREFTLEGQIAYYHTQIETGKVVQLIACEKENNNRPVGCTVLNEFCDLRPDQMQQSEEDEENHTAISSLEKNAAGGLIRHAEYGMFLGEHDAAGKGYSSEMVYLTLQYAFTQLGRDEVVCRIFTDNVPSIKGCERGGFRIAETIPDVECTDGTVKDMYLLRACRDEFMPV